MLAKEIMRKNVVTVRPETTLRELSKLFIERKISGAPVVDERGKMVGVVSQTDLVRRDHEAPEQTEVPGYYREDERGLSGQGYHVESPDSTQVSDVMTPAVLSADEATPIEAVAEFMLRERIHRVVITRQGKLAGIISSMDMLRALLDLALKPAGAARHRAG